MPTGDEGPNPELVDFTRRLLGERGAVGAAAASLPWAPMLGLPVRDWIGERLAVWIELALATPVVLWAAIPFFHRGWESIVNRSPNMWTLISIGVGVAYVYSVVATLFPGYLSAPVPRPWRRGAGLFRGGERDRRAGLSRPGAGAQGPRAHRLGDPRAARPRAEDRAADRRRRHRDRRAARPGAGRRPVAHPAGRQRFRSTASCSRAAPRSTNR